MGEEEEGMVAPRGDGKTTSGNPGRLAGISKEEEERWRDGHIVGLQPEGRGSLVWNRYAGTEMSNAQVGK